MPATFTVRVPELAAALAATTPGAFKQDAGAAVETYIGAASLKFQVDLKAKIPVRTGRGSQWERKNAKGPGTMRKSVRRTVKKAGLNTTARVRVGDTLANIVQSGAGPHLIKAKNVHFLTIGGRFRTRVSHPGFRANPFFSHALAAVEGDVGRLATKAGFATADKMAARIRKGR